MRKSRRAAIIAVLVLTGIALVAVPAAARRGRAGGWSGGQGRGMGPMFTEEQQDQIQDIHEKYADRQAELTNRLKVIMVDAKDSVGEGDPDWNAIERRMEEVADVRLELAKLRLDIHKEIRPLLDDDQKLLFDRGLGMMMHGGRGGCGMMGRGGMKGGMGPMGGGGPMGGPGMTGGRMGRGMHPGMGAGRGMGMGQGMGRGGEMMPWCPFADDMEDEGPDDD